MPGLTSNTRQHEHLSSGGRLVATNGQALPLRSTRLDASAGGGIARTLLKQTFCNAHAEPLTVTYQLPLPADGAVSAFAFRIGDRRIEGEIDRRSAARERFEEAIATGHSAALLEQDRSSLFTQEIGNIPPGAEIVAEITVDQPLAFVAGGMWEWRFPTAVAPRYLGGEGRVPDSTRVSVDVAAGTVPGRLCFELAVEDEVVGGLPTSSSHRLLVTADEGVTHVGLASEADCGLDRDVVVRWPVAGLAVGTELAVTRSAAAPAVADTDAEAGADAFGLLTIVPPGVVGSCVSRDVIVLIDTSGSMHGQPLDQAKHVVSAIVCSMTADDRLELIEFSDRPRRFEKQPVAVSASARADALRWIESLHAGGATEMRDAISTALASANSEAQRQVVLVSDGMIGFETEIVAEILEKLPPSSRVHAVGVGDAVNRSLTAGAARAGRGIEVILGIDDDPEPVAQRVVAHTAAPALVDLSIEGTAVLDVAPARLPDLFAGAPARIAVRLRAAGGDLAVHGRTATGGWERNLVVPASEVGSGRPEIRALYGRESVEDLEMQVAAGGSSVELDAKIESLGLRYQLATRVTSWIAVSSEATVDPRGVTRRERVPHELPHGMSVAGLGLRGATGMDFLADTCFMSVAAEAPSAKRGGLLGRLFGGGHGASVPVEESLRHHDLRKPEDVDHEDSSPARAPAESPSLLFGRITLHRDGWLVIEIDSSGIDWHLPDSAAVFFAGGLDVVACIETDRTTAEGPAPVGTIIRVVLRLPDDAPALAPSYIRFIVGGHDLDVTLN